MAAIDVDAESGLPGLVRAAHVTTAQASSTTLPPRSSTLSWNPKSLRSSISICWHSSNHSKKRWRVVALRGVRKCATARSWLAWPPDRWRTPKSRWQARGARRVGGVVVQDRIIQRRTAIDPRTVLGKGKLDELIIRGATTRRDMLVFDSELSPAQVRSLSEATDLKVIDRSRLILDIFAQRAIERRKDPGRAGPVEILVAAFDSRPGLGVLAFGGRHRRQRSR